MLSGWEGWHTFTHLSIIMTGDFMYFITVFLILKECGVLRYRERGTRTKWVLECENIRKDKCSCNQWTFPCENCSYVNMKQVLHYILTKWISSIASRFIQVICICKIVVNEQNWINCTIVCMEYLHSSNNWITQFKQLPFLYSQNTTW